MILSSSLSPALGLGGPVLSQNSAGDTSPPPTNTNLLLWTEELDNAVYVKTGATIEADYGDATYPSADQITFGPSGTVRQTSTTPAAAGDAVTALVTCDTTWERREVTGTFDGLPYVFHLDTIDRSGGGVPQVQLRIDRSGGFLRISVEDLGDEAIVGIARLQLEQSALATSYQQREGT